MSTTTTFRVGGMTCSHCVRAITDEVAKLAGVTSVDVDLSSGQVVVASSTPLDGADIAAAVDEAGYELVS